MSNAVIYGLVLGLVVSLLLGVLSVYLCFLVFMLGIWLWVSLEERGLQHKFDEDMKELNQKRKDI